MCERAEIHDVHDKTSVPRARSRLARRPTSQLYIRALAPGPLPLSTGVGRVRSSSHCISLLRLSIGADRSGRAAPLAFRPRVSPSRCACAAPLAARRPPSAHFYGTGAHCQSCSCRWGPCPRPIPRLGCLFSFFLSGAHCQKTNKKKHLRSTLALSVGRGA